MNLLDLRVTASQGFLAPREEEETQLSFYYDVTTQVPGSATLGFGWFFESATAPAYQGLPPTYGEPIALACSYDADERRIRIVSVGSDKVPQTLLDASVTNPDETINIDRVTLMALGLTDNSGYASGALHRVVYYDNQPNDINTLGLLAQNAYEPYN